MIQTQLNSKRRAELAALQGVNHSVYSEINPLHLPEVLALVGRHHGQKELYIALKSSIAGVISTVNREQCIEAQMAYMHPSWSNWALSLLPSKLQKVVELKMQSHAVAKDVESGGEGFGRRLYRLNLAL